MLSVVSLFSASPTALVLSDHVLHHSLRRRWWNYLYFASSPYFKQFTVVNEESLSLLFVDVYCQIVFFGRNFSDMTIDKNLKAYSCNEYEKYRTNFAANLGVYSHTCMRAPPNQTSSVTQLMERWT